MQIYQGTYLILDVAIIVNVTELRMSNCNSYKQKQWLQSKKAHLIEYSI